jgi:biotin synthase
VGDYLTTPGQAAHQDWDMIRDAGFAIESPEGSLLEVDSAVTQSNQKTLVV